MPLIPTPRQLSRRGELYHQLAVLISAGLSVHQALEQLKRNPPDRALREKISQWLDHLSQGLTVAQAVQRMGQWMPSFDLALIDAGEQSGRLDASFKLLALHYEERARMVKQAISDLLWPLFTLHMAIVVFPFVQFFKDGNVFRFAGTILGTLAVLYGAAYFIIYACQGRHGENWRATLERIFRAVPVLGTARHELALSRLSAALEALLNAGVPIIGAWELAATASGSPAIRRLVETWRPRINNGTTPSELVSESNQFPTVFNNLYHTGEVAGKLDETLNRLHALYLEEGTRHMRLVARWGPQILYFCVAIYVGYRVIQYYMGYFQMLNDVEKF
ncbi:MAG TPA: type II secretion system F family protein [Verrucomicrobiae bacterium]|jgi:type IV pilus assembly protein PilC